MLRLCKQLITAQLSSRIKQSLRYRLFSLARKMPGCTDIVWIDLEMTGLDVETHKILEFACLITDKDLNIKSTGPCIVIKQPKEVLDGMNDWCVKQHTESGLVQKVMDSQITPTQAEGLLLKYLEDNVPSQQCPLAGNSVYMDRLFLRMQMPKVDAYLHYRIIDTSTIKELSRRWNPSVYSNAPVKKLTHRSLEDIKESIAELRFYREAFFQLPAS